MKEAQLILQRALAACHKGQTEEAASFARSVLLAPAADVDAIADAGRLLIELGERAAGADALDLAVSAAPDRLDLISELAEARFALGEFDAAATAFQQAAALTPDNAALHNNLAVALQAVGRFEEAVQAGFEAIRLEPDYMDALFNLGVALQLMGDAARAVEPLTRLVALCPEHVLGWNTLGCVLYATGKEEEAAAAFARTDRLVPADADIRFQRALALQRARCFEAAERWYREALALSPNNHATLANLANTLQAQSRMEEALALHRQCVQLNPDCPLTIGNLGNALSASGRKAEAIRHFRKALAIDPECVEPHFNLGVALLGEGRYAEGWPEYEWRAKLLGFPPAGPSEMRWDGSPLAGRAILLHCEQGFGDTIHCLRYLPLVAAAAGRTMLVCQEEICCLIQRSAWIDTLIARPMEGAPRERTEACKRKVAALDFDLCASLLSLPYLFGTTLDTIPDAVPYLPIDTDLVAAWRERLAGCGGLRVGLVWSGNPRFPGDLTRSCRLDDLAPLASVAGVQFYSLQKGPRASEAAHPPAGMELIDLSEALTDFSQTAAAMQAMDLVISTCTAPLHLAGALGVPVWAALQLNPDWRWLRYREDSPWYPTMRLFRQTRAGDWNSVFGRMSEALRGFGAATAPVRSRRRRPA